MRCRSRPTDPQPTPAWTAEAVKARLEQAVSTLRCRHDQASPHRAVPGGAEIDEMHEVIKTWLPLLAEGDARIVWTVACDVPWWLLATRHRKSERTVKRRHAAAIGLIVERLNRSAV